MRLLELAAWSFLLSLLLLNSEDRGAQESSQEELRKHNEDDLVRKEMQVQFTEVVSKVQAI
jgi:hypothetical protein